MKRFEEALSLVEMTVVFYHMTLFPSPVIDSFVEADATRRASAASSRDASHSLVHCSVGSFALSPALLGLKFLRSASLFPPRNRTRLSNSSLTNHARTSPRSATTHPMLWSGTSKGELSPRQERDDALLHGAVPEHRAVFPPPGHHLNLRREIANLHGHGRG